MTSLMCAFKTGIGLERRDEHFKRVTAADQRCKILCLKLFYFFRVVCGLGVSMVARVFIVKTHMHVRAKNRRLKKRKEGHLVKEILLFVY